MLAQVGLPGHQGGGRSPVNPPAAPAPSSLAQKTGQSSGLDGRRWAPTPVRAGAVPRRASTPAQGAHGRHVGRWAIPSPGPQRRRHFHRSPNVHYRLAQPRLEASWSWSWSWSWAWAWACSGPAVCTFLAAGPALAPSRPPDCGSARDWTMAPATRPRGPAHPGFGTTRRLRGLDAQRQPARYLHRLFHGSAKVWRPDPPSQTGSLAGDRMTRR